MSHVGSLRDSGPARARPGRARDATTLHEAHEPPCHETRPDETRLRDLAAAQRVPLARYLARLGVPEAELDDAVQEVLIVAASKLSQVRPENERPFLFATALRIASNARRGQFRRRRMQADLSEATGDPPPTVEELTDELFGRALLDEALDHMPQEARLVFQLVELEEMPIPGVALRLGVPEGTVASRLRRARGLFGDWCGRVRGAQTATHGTDGASPSGALPAVGKLALEPEILSWWVRRGEIDALSALLGVYGRTRPRRGAIVRASADGHGGARSQLSPRMLRGAPPDTFQVNGGHALFSWVKRTAVGEQMDPIDFLFASEGWESLFPRDVLDLVSHRGRIYAVPLNIHRTNSLFFNPRLLRESGLVPPTSLDELYRAADALTARGVTPLAFGYREPWTLTMLAFESVLVAECGVDYYQDFFAGRRSADDPELRRMLEHVGRMLDYANDDAALLSWDGAVDLVRHGRAAMTFMGDWAKGYLTNEGCVWGEHFGQAPSPGAADAFVFTTDVFGLPKRANHRSDAIDLLKVFGSREGQDAFNPLKGSIPARMDVDLSLYDPLSRASVRDFRRSRRVPSVASIAPSAFTRSVERALHAFARSRDTAAVIAVVRAHYDLLRL